ncbi:nitronate monooxygenase [Massilia sp. R2A-15]|uniref:NAD(P)H-dependent flavin oxidoreductase n=1 Tax=Massilia sp. R2A-15 TaxID=3064278 RepID=UPI002736EC80|nr:nitronate monooxygenase [Massilia sp. R2A-15]WLI89053.1 nitronate monooxygenase [Massilia sp. R2A-15]
MDVLSLMEFPIIQGPMAGGACTPALVAGVSNAGGLGSFPGSLLAPAAIREQVGQIRGLTDRPFQMNFFVQPTPHPSEAEVQRGIELLRPVWQSLGWSELALPKQWCQDFDAQFDELVALKPAAASFTFGILTETQVERLHSAGIAVIGTVTTVDEALAWEAVGADAVVASGVEAGGHRGTFLGPQEDATLSARELWSWVSDAVQIPVIAAGGIMTGVDIRDALALGASAVQMGTAFLVTDESGIHPAYKQHLLSGTHLRTRLTRAFSGRLARGVENRFMEQMRSVETQVPAYPVQNALTGGIRAAAAERGDIELMSMWAGAEVGRSRALSVAQLMQTLVAEMRPT